MLRTKQIWYNVCYYLGKLVEQHSEAFFQELQIHFFDFWIEIWPSSYMNQRGFSPLQNDFWHLWSCCLSLYVCLSKSYRNWLHRPQFSAIQKTVWFYLPGILKKPCIQAECSPLGKNSGNVCSEESFINKETSNLDMVLWYMINRNKETTANVMQVIIHPLNQSHVYDYSQDHPSFRQELIEWTNLRDFLDFQDEW